MALWMLRGGRAGERERRMVEEAVVSVGWQELPDLSALKDRDALDAEYRRVYPESRETRIASHVNQLLDFVSTAAEGDLVVMPLSSRPAVAVAEIAGDYAYRPDLGGGMAHVRPVKWLRSGLSRDYLPSSLLEAFESYATFFRVEVEEAEPLLRNLAADPSTAQPVAAPAPPARAPRGPRGHDVAREARDQIVDALGRKFRGRELPRFVQALLQAQGFLTRREEDSERHCVLLAGGGALGFGVPRTCVTIVTSDRPAGAEDVDALKERMTSLDADHGLLVSWSGFGEAAHSETRDSFFRLRLWGPEELLGAFLCGYEALPEELRAQVPLKRVWALASRR